MDIKFSWQILMLRRFEAKATVNPTPNIISLASGSVNFSVRRSKHQDKAPQTSLFSCFETIVVNSIAQCFLRSNQAKTRKLCIQNF